MHDQFLHQSDPRWRQAAAKLAPKNNQKSSYPSDLRAKNGILHRPLGPKIRKKIISKKQRNKKQGGVSQRPPFGAEKVANMAPSWVPKSIKNQLKIDAKIDQKFDASWD